MKFFYIPRFFLLHFITVASKLTFVIYLCSPMFTNVSDHRFFYTTGQSTSEIRFARAFWLNFKLCVGASLTNVSHNWIVCQNKRPVVFVFVVKFAGTLFSLVRELVVCFSSFGRFSYEVEGRALGRLFLQLWLLLFANCCPRLHLRDF